MSEGSYVSPAGDPGEAHRLRQQAGVVWAAELAALRQHGLTEGLRVLDLGCGPAAVLGQLVAAAPPRCAVGVDRELDHLRRSPAPRRVVQALAGTLPFADASFDLVTMRLVLRHLAEPAAVLRETVRVTAPGGRVCITDVDDAAYLLDGAPASWEVLRAALDGTARRRGADPWVGRTLQRRLADAGLEDVRVTPLPVQTSAALSAAAFVELLLAPEARPVDGELMAPQDASAAWASLRIWARQPGAYACTLAFIASGRKSVEPRSCAGP